MNFESLFFIDAYKNSSYDDSQYLHDVSSPTQSNPWNLEAQMQYVIIGNGIAGISAAETIRQLDPEGAITMIGDELAVPYSRPMISMILEGSIPSEKLPIRSPTIYEDLNIETFFGNRISEIAAAQHEVMIEGGQRVPFDRLLIATGADARIIQVQGSDLQNIHYMRTEAHVRQIISVLPQVRKPLVLGGGLVGFKAAYGLLKRGLKPTMLITSPYPLSMQVDNVAGRMILDELVRHGLTVRTGTSVDAFEGTSMVEGALLSDGSALPCDLVIAGKRGHSVPLVCTTEQPFSRAGDSCE